MIQVAQATKTLLFSEDNAKRQQWGERLKQLSPHYVFLEAVDGQSGLDVCRKQRVDCVILDLDLPDISGFEVLFTLKLNHLYPTMAVVVLTRFGSPVIHQMTKENGAQECLFKGRVTAEILDEAVRRAMRIVGAA
jgi:DNA-binding NarL/FixJ family response regulator